MDVASDRVLKSFHIKVHSSICSVLKILVERVLQLLPTVEASRPGGTAGIQALCSLNQAVEKAKLLLEHCAESSKLFLAIRGESILLRCERIRNTLEVNLSQIQDMVPQPLASQISEVVSHLRTARFTLDISEDKAGKILLLLLYPEKFATGPMEISELDAFKDVALRLYLTSCTDLLIEKRSLRKQLEKLRNSDPNSENVLKYLFYLLKKHGKLDTSGKNENEDAQHSDQCSHSRMRTTCNSVHENLTEPIKPMVHANSLNDVPSFLLESKAVEFLNQKDISYVSISSSSDASCYLDTSCFHILSTESFMSGDLLQLMSSWNEDECHMYPSFSKLTCEMYIIFLSRLSLLPCELQNRVLENVKIYLKENADTFYSQTSNNFVVALMKYLKDAHARSDVNALKIGTHILLAFVTNTRELPSLRDDVFKLVAEFLLIPDISSEAIEILQNFTWDQCDNKNIVGSGMLHSIVKILDMLKGKALESAIKILGNLSMNNEIRSEIILSGCITKIISCLIDGKAACNCMKILQNLCDISEDTRSAVVDTEGCLSSVIELLDNGTRNEQEYAVALLFCLCSCGQEYCHLVMKEGVIPALVTTSVNGNNHAKEISLKLLQLLKDTDFGDASEELHSQVDPISELSQDFSNSCNGVRPAFRTTGFFRNKFKLISKLKSLALF